MWGDIIKSLLTFSAVKSCPPGNTVTRDGPTVSNHAFPIIPTDHLCTRMWSRSWSLCRGFRRFGTRSNFCRGYHWCGLDIRRREGAPSLSRSVAVTYSEESPSRGVAPLIPVTTSAGLLSAVLEELSVEEIGARGSERKSSVIQLVTTAELNIAFVHLTVLNALASYLNVDAWKYSPCLLTRSLLRSFGSNDSFLADPYLAIYQNLHSFSIIWINKKNNLSVVLKCLIDKLWYTNTYYPYYTVSLLSIYINRKILRRVWWEKAKKSLQRYIPICYKFKLSR